MSDNIFSRPTTKEYREGWERIYGGSQSEPDENKVLVFQQRYRQLHPNNTRFSEHLKSLRRETLKELAQHDQEIGI